MMNTHLLHALPAEQARCRELVRRYVAIGSAGAFASALIEHSLRRADRAATPADARNFRSEAADLLETRLGDPERAREMFSYAASYFGNAEAQYNLARAYLSAGKKPEARRFVLRSLENAPSFEKAQELLLKIRGQ